MYNRKQRRDMEKKLGLFKQFALLPKDKQEEIRERRAATGKQIHLQNQQSREQYEQEYETKKYQQRIDFWKNAGLGDEEAVSKTDEEYRIDNERWEKKRARKMKTS